MNIIEIDGDELDNVELSRLNDETCLICKGAYDGWSIMAARLKHRTLWWHHRPNVNSPSCKTLSPVFRNTQPRQ